MLLTALWSFIYEQEKLIFSEIRVLILSDNIALCQGTPWHISQKKLGSRECCSKISLLFPILAKNLPNHFVVCKARWTSCKRQLRNSSQGLNNLLIRGLSVQAFLLWKVFLMKNKHWGHSWGWITAAKKDTGSIWGQACYVLQRPNKIMVFSKTPFILIQLNILFYFIFWAVWWCVFVK